ncbi:transcription initiation factor TFIID subunit 4-like, partial [Camarhynchus parvulus]|uniref:transcription initiation factor TFIID subunit 4-like n=1 Tax=Geospiza parvula TaxID=87175 RepID=UPI001237CF50
PRGGRGPRVGVACAGGGVPFPFPFPHSGPARAGAATSRGLCRDTARALSRHRAGSHGPALSAPLSRHRGGFPPDPIATSRGSDGDLSTPLSRHRGASGGAAIAISRLCPAALSRYRGSALGASVALSRLCRDMMAPPLPPLLLLLLAALGIATATQPGPSRDLLRLFGLPALPPGVRKVPGPCPGEAAWSLEPGTRIRAPARRVLPGEEATPKRAESGPKSTQKS